MIGSETDINREPALGHDLRDFMCRAGAICHWYVL
jgi:hypothetical protein